MAMDAKVFLAALDEIEASKGISKETTLKALEEAMAKGFRKQLGGDDALVRVTIDPQKGTIDMCQIKMVVDEVEDDFLQISVEDANAANPKGKYKVGDEFIIPASVEDLRKASAMSVKSMLKQKFAEAEKDILYEAFKDKINTMITGRVEKTDERGVSVNIGRTSVFLPRKEMIGDEKFNAGDPIKLFISDVASGTRGAHIVVSRANEGFLKCLFEEEIHEVYDGTIQIKAIAREAGERSKVAVYSPDPTVDPAGACIGPNGTRIQKVVGQLGNGNNKEKIDIIGYSSNTAFYIMEALKPAKVAGIALDEENKSAIAIVKDDSLSLAIGRRGVNARLAVRLTGYKIDIKTETEANEEGLEYVTFEELQAQETENREKLILEAREAAYKELGNVVLPGLPEGYVAPQERVYEDESDQELESALEEASEKEEEKPLVKETPVEEEPVKEVPPVEEEKVEEPVKEEKPVEVKEVKTTTSLSDLEKSLEEESSRNQKKQQRNFRRKKNDKDEEEEEKSSIVPQDNGVRMSIYTEEELREMEEEEARESEQEEDDVDYDDYDDYYDDDDR